jgi:hypothetical protein
MKLKHLIAWIIYFSLLASIVMLFGCSNSELTRKIESYKKMYPDRPGDCLIHAMRAKAKYERLGRQARICHGTWKGKGHAWVEYLDGDKWIVDDKSLGHRGWEREAYKHYELTWWGE